MKRGELINKGIAGAVTVGFMAVVRPDPMPSMVETAFITVLMYEVVRWCVWYVRKTNKKRKEDRYITTSLQDMRRWANEKLYWPMEEVN
jgi:hypothetical protein